MTKCWICGASELQVPNHKIKFTGKIGKLRPVMALVMFTA